MWIRSSGQLTENTVQLTTPTSSHLYILGDAGALVDTGISATAERLIQEIEPYAMGDYPLKTVFITHAHFDHLGGLPFLRRRFPGLQVVGSSLTAEMLSDRELLKKIRAENVKCCEAFGVNLEIEEAEWLSSFRFDRLVSEGDSVLLGDGVEVKVIASPGHTADSTAYYLKGDMALAAGEAVGGYSGRDRVTSCFLSSRTDFIASLDKFLSLDVAALSLPHSGALTGDLAKRFLLGVRDEVDRFVEQIRQRVVDGSIREEIVMDLLTDWNAEGVAPEGPFLSAQEFVARQMIDLTLAEIGTALA